MFFPFDTSTLRFGEPAFLWLVLVPLALLVLWAHRIWLHWRDRRRLRRSRTVPVREQVPMFGDLLFWLFLLLASAVVIVALSRPMAVVGRQRTLGVDLVVLQDGSASMHVRDVAGNRWRRSMRFLRSLAESLRWRDDRLALTIFANIAAPQVRLTRDPTTFMFFLDHLQDTSPFPLKDVTTWNTNIELGISWGLRQIARDEELHGRSANARAFLLISDGQAWTGEVAQALGEAKEQEIPVFVVGVGTTGGGIIPEEPGQSPESLNPGPIASRLDRASLRAIADAGGGEYFELDRATDRVIASAIIEGTHRRVSSRDLEEATEDLYWRCLVFAAGLVLVGALFIRDRYDMWLHAGGAAAALVVLWYL